ncbi:ribosome small subunit-dependent GTPase A [Caldicellulosiruptor naganoensis]|uniref:Small ribosomal subunit biogenesis GTPase RsgA n=1 Tax=Caldicellulosiruptor naganoensis TaxID=29324 RepID=A0ABY7BKK3_9FIRM|nr:ribosome small subunit-dependent GTPase A [Caldicellulosiruptor naganoensis]WAM32606.1 ribosome small subunit-dependent GTPase A [Caldicellulosiruptor naganoensis]
MEISGVIVKAIAGFYYVYDHNGNIYECRARGVFRKEEITPLVGDHVTIVEKAKGAYVIDKIHPRRNQLIRPPIANVDIAIVVVASVSPEVSFIALDKLLVNVLKEKVKPLICVNKIDLDNGKTFEIIKNQYSVFDVIGVSAKTGEGIEELKQYIKGKISVFAGQSGVGKTSILNCLIPGLNLKVGEISKKIERGRHTTRVVELLRAAEDTYIADTPGFSSIEIIGMLRDELKYYYPEFYDYENCKFPGCNHIFEPECGVKAAVNEKKINFERYERYKEIFMQLPAQKEYD